MGYLYLMKKMKSIYQNPDRSPAIESDIAGVMVLDEVGWLSDLT